MRQRGFTLVEILVSIALLGLIMAAILTPMMGLFGFSRETEDVLEVNTMIQQRLEQARVLVQNHYTDPAAFKDKLDTLGVSCKNIGLYGKLMNTSSDKTCYAAGASTPPMRRLEIKATKDDKTITGYLDVTQ